MANGLRWHYRLVMQTNCNSLRQKLKPELHVYLKFLLYKLCNEYYRDHSMGRVVYFCNYMVFLPQMLGLYNNIRKSDITITLIHSDIHISQVLLSFPNFIGHPSTEVLIQP